MSELNECIVSQIVISNYIIKLYSKDFIEKNETWKFVDDG